MADQELPDAEKDETQEILERLRNSPCLVLQTRHSEPKSLTISANEEVTVKESA